MPVAQATVHASLGRWLEARRGPDVQHDGTPASAASALEAPLGLPAVLLWSGTMAVFIGPLLIVLLVRPDPYPLVLYVASPFLACDRC